MADDWLGVMWGALIAVGLGVSLLPIVIDGIHCWWHKPSGYYRCRCRQLFHVDVRACENLSTNVTDGSYGAYAKCPRCGLEWSFSWRLLRLGGYL
jgi:hypothetical protein